MRRAAALVTAGGLILAWAAPAGAQVQEPPISRLLPELVKFATVIDRGQTDDHREHFVPGLSNARVLWEINQAILQQAAAFPFGPTSATSLPGPNLEPRPMFAAGYADSAFSFGASRLFLGLTYQTTTFDTMDGIDLRDSGITLYLPHAGLTGEESERDLLRHVVSLRLNRKVASFSLGYGWRDRVDIGVVVPIVQMAADARILTQIVRTASTASIEGGAVHEFDIIDRANRTFPRFCSVEERSPDNPDLPIDVRRLECTASSTARGIGDIVARAKFALTGSDARSALAVSVDARLPTGSKDEMIGLGAFQVKPAILWSVDAGRVGGRARAEYTWSDGESTALLAEDVTGLDLAVSDEIGVGAGLDVEIARRTTLSADVLGRWISGAPSFATGSVVFPNRGPGPLPSAPYTAENVLLADGARDLTQVLTALGLSFDVPGGVVAQVSAVFPVHGGGLRPQTMAAFSLTKRY